MPKKTTPWSNIKLLGYYLTPEGRIDPSGDVRATGRTLKIPVYLQSRESKNGGVYRWKELYDRNQGDASDDYASAEDAIHDALSTIDDYGNPLLGQRV